MCYIYFYNPLIIYWTIIGKHLEHVKVEFVIYYKIVSIVAFESWDYLSRNSISFMRLYRTDDGIEMVRWLQAHIRLCCANYATSISRGCAGFSWELCNFRAWPWSPRAFYIISDDPDNRLSSSSGSASFAHSLSSIFLYMYSPLLFTHTCAITGRVNDSKVEFALEEISSFCARFKLRKQKNYGAIYLLPTPYIIPVLFKTLTLLLNHQTAWF